MKAKIIQFPSPIAYKKAIMNKNSQQLFKHIIIKKKQKKVKSVKKS